MELGTRVVRGPDWEWKNQDGGEGSAGTVVQLGQEDEKSPSRPQLVWVQWDCGTKASYRAGIDGKHDLRVLDNANAGVRHVHVLCDGCDQEPIVGMRWHCLGCPNFDLCTTCYMTDKHNLHHPFERIDKSRGKGVPVGGRYGSTKLEVRGIFKGANVARGPDWKYKNQDGGSEFEGVVTEITGWDDKSKRDAARVSWERGQRENIYRIGREGKVDLKCTKPAVGGTYYRDHLPPLTMEIKKTKGGLTTGDKVYVHVTKERLKQLSADHGGWNKDMEKFIGTVGVVNDFTPSGDVLVEYPNRRWRYNPEALTKVPSFKRGDEVLIKSDKNLVKELQQGHGGWNEAMISILGRTGKVVEVDGSGDLVTLVEDDRWILNPAAVTYVTDPDTSEGQGSSEASGGFSLDGGDFLARLLSDLFQQRSGGSGNSQSNELINACRNNRLSRVREILDANPEKVNEMEGGHTALQVASHEGNCDVIRLLLDRGAHQDAMDTQGYTAMHHATYGDRSGGALKLLLERGLNPNVRNLENGSTPLHLAVKRTNHEAVRILTQFPGCDVNIQDEVGDTPLFDAISQKENGMVDLIMANPGLSMAVANRGGFNYLHYACLKGNTYAVEKLLERAGDVLDVPKSDGFSSLHIAAINDHRNEAKLLLRKGCVVDARSEKWQTPLHLAATEGYSAMVELLLDHGADVNAEDVDGDTALHISLAKEALFKAGVDAPSLQLLLELHTGQGDSESYASVSRFLLRYGANVNHFNGRGETPLEKCSGSGVEALVLEIAASGGTRVEKIPTFSAVGRAGVAPNGLNTASVETRPTGEWERGGQEAASDMCDFDNRDNQETGINEDSQNDAVANGNHQTTCDLTPAEGNEVSQETCQLENTCQEISGEAWNDARGSTNSNDEDTNEEYSNVEKDQSENSRDDNSVDNLRETLENVKENVVVEVTNQEPSTDDKLDNYRNVDQENEEMETDKQETCEEDDGNINDEMSTVQESIPCASRTPVEDEICMSKLDDYRNVDLENEEMGTDKQETCEEDDGNINDEMSTVQESIPCASRTPMEDEISMTEECDVSATAQTSLLSEEESKEIYAEDKEQMKEESAKGDVGREEEALAEPGQPQERASALDVSTDSNELQCQICEENEADVVFKPCGHSIVCTECSSRLKRCLKCKSIITAKGRRDGEPISGLNNKSMTVRYQLLEGKVRKMEESLVCCICVERRKNVIFLCGHGTCHSCAEQLRVCHICQKRIDKKVTVF